MFQKHIIKKPTDGISLAELFGAVVFFFPISPKKNPGFVKPGSGRE
jgi:hypothetical protein